MKVKSNEVGICPICDSDDLDYGCFELLNGSLGYYPYTCKNCGCNGEEFYEMIFNGHNINTDEGNFEVDELLREEEEDES